MATGEHCTLADRVQALPPELFNNIFDLVFTYDASSFSVRKPPPQLQVDRRSREAWAKLYYERITIRLKPKAKPSGKKSRHIFHWFEALPLHHQSLIKRVRLERDLSRESTKAGDAVKFLYSFMRRLPTGVKLDWLGTNFVVECDYYEDWHEQDGIPCGECSAEGEEMWMDCKVSANWLEKGRATYFVNDQSRWGSGG